jgi:hypothetical protein
MDTIQCEYDSTLTRSTSQLREAGLQSPAELTEVDKGSHSQYTEVPSKHTYLDKPEWLLDAQASLPTPGQLYERVPQPSIATQLLYSDSHIVAGNTPLHQATLCGHLSIVKVFLDRGTDQAVMNSQGRTVLHIASESGHVDIVRLLLDYRQYIDTVTAPH